MGYSIGRKTVLWDRDDRSSGCGTVMKNELECGIRTPLTVPDKITAMALSLLQCQIHPDHGLDLFLNVCVNLMFNLSRRNFFSRLYSTTCITPKTLTINNKLLYVKQITHVMHLVKHVMQTVTDSLQVKKS